MKVFPGFYIRFPLSTIEIMTTGLAGGLLCPYKGLLPACARKAPEGFANRTTFSGSP